VYGKAGEKSQSVPFNGYFSDPRRSGSPGEEKCNGLVKINFDTGEGIKGVLKKREGVWNESTHGKS